MTYEQQKAKEIIQIFKDEGWLDSGAGIIQKELEVKIKEIIIDVRHKCVENVNEIEPTIFSNCHSAQN